MNQEALSAELDQLRDYITRSPEVASTLQEAASALSQEGIPAELLEELITMLYQAVINPEQAPGILQEFISSGVIEAEDIPQNGLKEYLLTLLCALDLVRDKLGSTPQGGLSALAPAMEQGSPLAQMGRRGDSIVAHINPVEARMLKRNSGSGTINPATGLPEFGFLKSVGNVFKSIAKVALPVAAAYFGGPLLAGALGGGALGAGLSGGVIGGLGSKFSGGNFAKGALLGGLGGLAGSFMAPAASGGASAFGDLGSGTFGAGTGGLGDSFMHIPGGFDIGSGLVGNSFGAGVDAVTGGLGSAASSAIAGFGNAPNIDLGTIAGPNYSGAANFNQGLPLPSSYSTMYGAPVANAAPMTLAPDNPVDSGSLYEDMSSPLKAASRIINQGANTPVARGLSNAKKLYDVYGTLTQDPTEPPPRVSGLQQVAQQGRYGMTRPFGNQNFDAYR